jgi:type II secretory pathway pseudopilin PulG
MRAAFREPGALRSRHGQTGGSKLFEFVFVVLLVGVLSMVVLEYMLHYIEVAEKSAMENTVMNLRSSLRLRLAEVLVHNDVTEGIRLARDNPMNWLQEMPPNYAGEFNDPEPGSIAPGKWYFDTKSRELVYLVDRGREFVPDREGMKRVRYRIYASFLQNAAKENRQPTVNDVVGDISLVIAEPYRWEFK